MSIFSSCSERELLERVWGVLSSLELGDRIAMKGPMGVGKTTLVRALLEKLGSDSDEFKGSPTFPIVHTYEIKGRTISHIDLYRTSSLREVEEKGILEILFDREQIVFIEWLEKYPEIEKKLGKEFKLIGVSLDFIPDAPQRRDARVEPNLKSD